FFNEIKYQFMFYDEFHQLSNDGTNLFQMICSIRARFKFGLSSTPFLNDIPDMAKLPLWIGKRWNDEDLKKLWDKKTVLALARNLDRTLAAKEVRKMLQDFIILRNEKSRIPDGSTIVDIPNMKLYEVDSLLRNKPHMMMGLHTSGKWRISHASTYSSRWHLHRGCM